MVCVVQKANGKRSFPKGGRKTLPEEDPYDCAIREWRGETGILRDRLRVRGDCDVYDEVFTGTRFALAECSDIPIHHVRRDWPRPSR
jgi:8-oxo-dGTP pyrophosphatase MutT (NUDIX family)